MVEKSNSPNFDAIFLRIKKETGVKSVRQLSEIIGKTHPTVSVAKKKDNFSASWAYEVEKKFGLLTRWIMTGEGPKRVDEVTKGSRYQILNEVEEWLKEEIEKNPDNEVWFQIQVEKSIPGFKEWRERRNKTSDENIGFKKQANGSGWK
ncbi:MAG: helix-turn-helix domain-containing protein [Desulfobulbus sp.]